MNDPTEQTNLERRVKSGHTFGAWPGKKYARLVVSLLAMMAFWPGKICGQTNAAAGRTQENRWLLVVETSRSMQHRHEGTLQSIQQALASGMNGQLRRGDTLGIWTFNEQVYAGRFPLEQWSPERKKEVSNHVLSFLQAQKYEKQGGLDKIIPALASIAKRSPFITIILIADGLDDIRGTPFDAEINATYAKWRERQKQTQMPMVTVLRAQQGQLSYHSVNPATVDIALSELPPELLIAHAAPKPLPPVPQKAPPLMLPPLIVSGKKPALAPAQNPAEITEPKPGSTASVVTSTADSAQTQDARPAAPIPAAAIVAIPQTNTVAAARLAPPPSSLIKSADSVPQPAPKAEVAPFVPKTTTPAPTPATETTHTPLASSDPPKPAAIPEPALAPKANEASSPPVAATHSQPLQAATTAPARNFFTTTNIGVGALLAIMAACGAIWLRRRRTPPVHQVSLITRSLDRTPQRR